MYTLALLSCTHWKTVGSAGAQNIITGKKRKKKKKR